MATVFAQMWLLCLAAFLLGALLTWLLVARPARRSGARAAASGPSEPVDPVRAAQAPPTPIPGVPRHARPEPTHPALSGLDASARGRRRRQGVSAIEALDRLRHGPDTGRGIPRQPGPGPRDRPPADRGDGLFTPPEPRSPEPDSPPDVPSRRQPPDDELT